MSSNNSQADTSVSKNASATVPVTQKVGYGTGMISYSLMANGYNQMVNPIFNVALGISPVLIGWVTAIGRLWDSLTDPIMGMLTDNTRSRLGRRRPWIALGGIFGALAFILVWWFPTGQSDTFNFIWLLATTLLFYVGFTVFSVPYIALGMEVSSDYHERTRVIAYRNFIGPIGAFGAQSIFWFPQLTVFDGSVEGMRYTSIGVAFFIIAAAFVPVFFSREHPSLQRVTKQEKVSLVKSAKQTLKVKPFVILALMTMVLLLSLQLVNKLGFYVNVFYVYGGDQRASAGVYTVAGFAYQASSMLCIPLIAWASKKYGKKRTLTAFLLVACVGTLSKWWCYNPEYPYLQLIPNILMGAGLAAAWMLINAMIPDTVDYDELTSGTRREGMFSAVYGWTFKVGLTLALLFSGYILDWSGFDALLGADQSKESILAMRILYTAVPGVGIPLGLWLLFLYPINEKRAYEIREMLEQKNNQPPGADD
jgi:GPH family glycoside/pentoside/hexuronide:cation symporter